jgi:rubrerythrin
LPEIKKWRAGPPSFCELLGDQISEETNTVETYDKLIALFNKEETLVRDPTTRNMIKQTLMTIKDDQKGHRDWLNAVSMNLCSVPLSDHTKESSVAK